MGQRDNFAGGFFLGTVVGGLVGGILGAVLASRSKDSPTLVKEPEDEPLLLDSEESIELARQRLEDKIAQLNLVIDDVRHQLGTVNEIGDRRDFPHS